MFGMYIVARDTVRWVLRPPRRHDNNDRSDNMRGAKMMKVKGGGGAKAKEAETDPAYQPEPVLGIMMAGWVVTLVVGASLPMDWATYAALLGYWPAVGILALVFRGL